MAKEKQISTNELATMVQRGFEGVDKQFEAVGNRINVLETKMEKRFDGIDKRLDHIENILLRAHENRLDRLEDFMRQAKTTLKIK